MPLEPRRSARRLPAPSGWRPGLALALSALLGACSVTPLPPVRGTATAPGPTPTAPAPVAASPAPATDATPAPALAPTTAPATEPANGAAPAAVTAPPASMAPSLVMPASTSVNANEATLALLRYADRVRALTPPELTLEIVALGDPGNQPARQLQLALALAGTAQPVDTARALGLAQRAANSAAPDAAPYKPIARLIAHRLLEQRKLEENVDRQAQQLREQQRRLDLLNERLEAMRAIERSLNNRTPAVTPRPPTP